jgi:hypothetical protein
MIGKRRWATKIWRHAQRARYLRQATFHDWITAEEVNSKITLHNERATQLNSEFTVPETVSELVTHYRTHELTEDKKRLCHRRSKYALPDKSHRPQVGCALFV